MTLENNPYQNIVNLKKATKRVIDLAEAISTPIVDETIRYGLLSLNTKSGLLKYQDTTQILLNKSKRPYKIVETLILNGGTEVGYDIFAEKLKADNTPRFHIKVRSTIKELRRQLGINTAKDKERNIFIPTGQGFMLV